MRTSILIAGAAAALIAAVESRDAYACGGCIAPPTSSTQVSGHRMILSISPTQTTLWDQLAYVGDASDFAWVLPIHGQVDVGLSSDLLFATLDQLTDPRVTGTSCPPQPICNTKASGAFMSTSGTGVTVIAEEVVGPYETVQLQSSDPTALQTWLDGHGFVVPAEVQSVVAQYVNEGFDFLAMRLVPGQGTSAMRPVRITSPGAGLSLPLRMVAVGTGAITPIKLWVFGEGRYTTANAPRRGALARRSEERSRPGRGLDTVRRLEPLPRGQRPGLPAGRHLQHDGRQRGYVGRHPGGRLRLRRLRHRRNPRRAAGPGPRGARARPGSETSFTHLAPQPPRSCRAILSRPPSRAERRNRDLPERAVEPVHVVRRHADDRQAPRRSWRR